MLIAWPLMPVAASFYGVTRFGVQDEQGRTAAPAEPRPPTATAR